MVVDKVIARRRNVNGRNNHFNRRERLYAKRRRLYAQVVNVRNDHHHNATTSIAKTSGRMVVETINVAGMMINLRLSRAIVDAGMSVFLVKPECKCLWYCAGYVNADRRFA